MSFRNEDFVHFHAHSSYSQFDGLCSPLEMAMQARKMGFPALALTDHGNVQGWIKFLQACRTTKDKKGKDIPYAPIKPILGCEFYLARKMNIGQYEEKRDTALIKKIQPDGRRGNRHLNLYAMNFKGYKNICRMSQRSYVEGFYYDPRIDIELLSKHSEGVMCGSACLSSVINANLMYGRYDKAKEICSIFKDIFKDNFFLEVMYHGISEEKEIVPLIFKLSSELDIPVICTNDSHYIKNNQGQAQEVLLCMSQQRCIKDPDRLKFGHMEFYLKSVEEMAKIFKDVPNCFTNSIAMAERIDTKNIEENLFGGMRLPKFDIPKPHKDAYDYLSALAWEGMKKIGWDKSKEHVEALKKELADVLVAKENNNYDFSTYFLIVRDYIQEAKSKGILVGCGRGSGYSSVLLRCVGITYGIDPLKYGLLWERFLGFSDSRFIKATDFGFEEDVVQQIADRGVAEEDRDVEDDLGGVDRY
jgi:DNA polymerase III subunit alpha